jgi:hypothetical protein
MTTLLLCLPVLLTIVAPLGLTWAVRDDDETWRDKHHLL